MLEDVFFLCHYKRQNLENCKKLNELSRMIKSKLPDWCLYLHEQYSQSLIGDEHNFTE